MATVNTIAWSTLSTAAVQQPLKAVAGRGAGAAGAGAAASHTGATVDGVAAQDAISALTNLGYGQPEAARAVAGVIQEDAHADVSALIRLALKKLSGG